MALTSYAEVRPWAKAIKSEVLGRTMPPWGAVRGFGEFAGDESLTQDEIMRIAEWVEGGAPEGDSALLPGSAAFGQRVSVEGTRVRHVNEGSVVLGIRPLADVADEKVVAVFRDGRVEPVIWLRGYKQAWNRTFVLLQPLTGARIVSKVPLEFLIKARRR